MGMDRPGVSGTYMELERSEMTCSAGTQGAPRREFRHDLFFFMDEMN